MKILVDRLKDSPVSLHFDEERAWRTALEESDPELAAALVEPIAADVRAHRMGQDLYVEGRLAAELGLECGRCLARYRAPLSESFRLVLTPAGSRVPAEPQAAEALARDGLCLGDELETGWYQGHEIELGGFFRELLALALPVQPVCREECKGLCPVCGADRNTGPCGCEEPRPNTPFAALEALRTRGER
jgi:uncharacterized protein